MSKYERLNAKEVLKNLEERIEELKNAPFKKCFYMTTVCDELNIFDWFQNTIALNKLTDMRKFLKESIKLGFDGYVCFKVGATGCANGMWAHKETSTDGYSPSGDFIYKSFTPDYNCWQIRINDIAYPSRQTNEEFDKCKTIKQFENYIAENNLL